jgi:hypothetical protein
LGQFSVRLTGENGIFTATDAERAGETVWFANGNGLIYDGNATVTDSDPSAFTLIPNDMKIDCNLDFMMPEGGSFTFNGIVVNAGVHDTEENYDAYAQPTLLSVEIIYDDGFADFIDIPLSVCEFQSAPEAYVFLDSYENVQTVAFYIVNASGEQEYIAISEVSIF